MYQQQPQESAPRNPDREPEVKPALTIAPPPQPAVTAPPAKGGLDLQALGFSREEAEKLGVLENADDEAEKTYAANRRTEASPMHRAVWSREVPVQLFAASAHNLYPDYAERVQQFEAITKRHIENGTIYNAEGKVSDQVWKDLGAAGYWGQLNPQENGGLGASFRDFISTLRRMAAVDPTTAGLSSVHQCIGACGPLRIAGTEEQKSRLLPALSSGEARSAFALTEPGAGSDLSAVATTATFDGKVWRLTGEKRFITNAEHGGTVGVIAKIDGQLRVFIVKLPETDTPEFKMVNYGLYALNHANNRGLSFKNFPVEPENLLPGDGLKTAYQVLNLGRVALCANAAGNMRLVLSDIAEWAKYRQTYGDDIGHRALVQERAGRIASYIVGADATSDWCASLLDQGYRGEIECIVAKNFGARTQIKTARMAQQTHGGRTFLKGHPVGDNWYDLFAPDTYEGEGDMLSLALFKTLIKDFGKKYFEPIAIKEKELEIKFNPKNPMHLWGMREQLWNLGTWIMGDKFLPSKKPDLTGIDPELHEHATFACEELQKMSGKIADFLLKYQAKAPHLQNQMRDMSQRVQDLTVMLCTIGYASNQDDPIVKRAAAVLCDKLTANLQHRLLNSKEYRRLTKLGEDLIYGESALLRDVEPNEVLMPYREDLGKKGRGYATGAGSKKG